MQRKRTATEAFHHYADKHPKFDGGGSWLIHCGALIFRMTKSSQSYDEQWKAADAAVPLNKHWSRAPIGALHYFGPRNSSRSHVAIQIDVHGNLAMSSQFLAKPLGNQGLGTNTVPGYRDRSQKEYFGWSKTYGKNHHWDVSDFGVTPESVKKAAKTKGSGGLQTASLGVKPAKAEHPSAMVKRVAKYVNSRDTGFITAADTKGIRGPLYWKAVQATGRQDGLYGPGFLINGIPGPRSRSLEKHYAALTLTLAKEKKPSP